MPWLLGALGLLLLLGLLLRGFLLASPGQIRRAGVWLLAGIGAGAFVVLLVTGRIAQALPMLLAVAPLGWRLWRHWRDAGRFAAPGTTESQVETATLAMRLDHGTGLFSGRVKRGGFAGRELGELSLHDILALLADCAAHDAESVPLLEAWLDRARPNWRAAAAPPEGPAMDHGAALAVLGLGEGAGEEEIRAAHRRLMRQAHPDRGGSPNEAARLNAARDMLLARKKPPR
ncbi:J domain-containing protein [Teichococcus oryzae]|uniref:Molecular chaperone DnaJ n=1 Tax=Teichococcus oryzae TaxID=1608942 RepID=A0A5B2TGK5_9PROT|nr:molecular chaperone DnaJ [Pseudoroseomonas oryzae]KAA2213234.1 molecular chaperone DnaJ [Pseudoroseomonas oryzae]